MNPYLTDRGMIDRIVAAARRGVQVRLVIPQTSNNAQATAALKHRYPDLLDAGVEVWELPDTVVHAKVVVADDVVSFGTVNLDAWALYRNSEIMMIARSAETAALIEERLFEPDIARSTSRRAALGLARALRGLVLEQARTPPLSRNPANSREKRPEAYNLSRMKLLDRLAVRRRRKAHERYLEEREWQRLLAEKDTEETIRDAAFIWGVAGQATSNPGSGPLTDCMTHARQMLEAHSRGAATSPLRCSSASTRASTAHRVAPRTSTLTSPRTTLG